MVFAIPWNLYKYINAASIYTSIGIAAINLVLIFSLIAKKYFSRKESLNFTQNMILLSFQILAACTLFLAAAIRNFYG